MRGGRCGGGGVSERSGHLAGAHQVRRSLPRFVAAGYVRTHRTRTGSAGSWLSLPPISSFHHSRLSPPRSVALSPSLSPPPLLSPLSSPPSPPSLPLILPPSLPPFMPPCLTFALRHLLRWSLPHSLTHSSLFNSSPSLPLPSALSLKTLPSPPLRPYFPSPFSHHTVSPSLCAAIR